MGDNSRPEVNFATNFACKVMLPWDIIPENFMKIDQEMAEIFANQTMTKNNNNTEEKIRDIRGFENLKFEFVTIVTPNILYCSILKIN